ncbi:MAG TPA: MOSC N-terminal beta barrel domain-containing protein [Acidothermaceae bacterium]|nr:MOSC N-terminal beta barrel domain-containing protein [Acidothermaceae bacterium]
MRVTTLRIYPVKSLAGITVERADVEPWGLARDRRWGVFDEAGDSVTSRQLHDMLGLRAEPLDPATIRITDRDGGSVDVEAPVGGVPTPVTLTGQQTAIPAKSEAHDWLSQRVGHRVRLLWQPDPTRRPISVNHGGLPGDSLSLADDGPLLLATESSMAQLNAWIQQDEGLPDVPDIDPGDVSGPGGQATPARDGFAPLDIVRFRPNVVIDGDAPFAEDDWTSVRIGDVEFRTTVRCDRCVMTTIDPVTLAGGKEPIRTLARHRRWAGKTWFGIRLAPRSTGVISVGDQVVAG